MPWKLWLDADVIARPVRYDGPNRQDKGYFLHVPLWLPFLLVFLTAAGPARIPPLASL
ncbi:MAG: hypothetical protein JXQ73_30780 [Phycisphaerae bacterium]|nr:hypothetical protein [Phycisphaerae bacterium]